MQNNSERKELIKKLKKNKDIRIQLTSEEKQWIKAHHDIQNEDEYWLLAEHLKYLRKKRKTIDESSKEDINKQLHDTLQYLLIAETNDENIGRFNDDY